MKTVINYTIDDGIYLDYKNTDREFRQVLSRRFVFSAEVYGGKLETINLLKLVDYDGVKCIKFPANLSYFENCVSELGWSVGSVVDRRCDVSIAGLTTSIILKEEQQEMLERLADVDYSAIISTRTGWGKSLFITKIAEVLQKPILFICNRTSLIDNFVKDVNTYVTSPNPITKIDSEWYKGSKELTSINYCTVQSLDENIIVALKDRISLVCLEEAHLMSHGVKTREILYSLNPRHRIYLSATPDSLKFDGLIPASLSSNILSDEDNFDKTITVNHINLIPCAVMQNKYYSDQTYTTKKDAIFKNEDYLKSVSEMLAYAVIKHQRKIMIFVEDTACQETLRDLLKDYKVKVGCLNTNTTKKESKHLIENFDKGEYQVVIGGSALVQGLSFYSLNMFVNLNIKTNSNNLKQAKGRLQRVNSKICDKDKHYLQITIKGLTDYKWRYDKEAFAEFNYMKMLDTIESNMEGRALCSIMKSILA